MKKKSSSRHDITGQRFGRLVAAERIPGLNKSGQARYLCKCDCGGQTVTRAGYLREGRTKSCGCLSREKSAEKATTHGLSKHALFPTWVGMMQRCENPQSPAFKSYGGRGVFVCQRWRDVRAFIKDCEPLWAPGLSIDRIDNDGPYSPENTRWAGASEQSRNRRSNVVLTYSGKSQTLFEWAREKNIPPRTLWARIQVLKWPTERALTEPVRRK